MRRPCQVERFQAPCVVVGRDRRARARASRRARPSGTPGRDAGRDLGFVRRIGVDRLQVRAAEEHATVGIVIHPELHHDLNVQ